MPTNLTRTMLVVLLACSWFPTVQAQQNLRGWNTAGQTFLLWEHSKTMRSTDTYEIYRSNVPIGSLAGTTWIGRVFADDAANYRIQTVLPGARWVLPDGTGGSVTVAENQDYFVFTPHAPGKFYYAVVMTGDTTVGSTNTVGPITELPGSVTAHIQHQGLWLTVYAHWIDGNADHGSGRADYPVMGNEYSNGHGFNFAVWRPVGGLPPGQAPLVLFLHGGYGNLMQLAGTAPLLVKNGLLAALDDPLRCHFADGDSIGDMNTFWLGYRQEYNRFAPAPSAANDTVIDYTARRVWWEMEWIKNNLTVDPHRVSLVGASMGGEGTVLHTQLRPELFSAGLAFVPLLAGPRGMVDPWRIWEIFGDSLQLLPAEVNSVKYQHCFELMDQRWRMSQPHEEWPFTIMASGKNDERISWQDNLETYQRLDSVRTGFWYYWDERTHTEWQGAHFQSSEHLGFNFLTRFRNNQSYPGFSNMDLRPEMSGRQPDPGNGDPQVGDPWGTWGGYLEWDPETIVDLNGGWAATMWVAYESAHQNDIPASDTISVDVTPRRLQHFSPSAGNAYRWRLIKEVTGDSLQFGIVQADASGRITITGLRLFKEKTRLAIAGPITSVKTPFVISEPRGFLLQQNYPNPFNPSTVISFQLPENCHVLLKIFDVTGREVATLVDDNLNPGIHSIVYHPTDLPSGTYFYRLMTPTLFQTKSMELIK